jgi:hypothetical protein
MFRMIQPLGGRFTSPAAGGGGAAAAAFAPSDISDLVGWESDFGTYQERTGASATTAAVADADPIGTWVSKYGGPYYLVAASDAVRPTLDTGQLNSLPVTLWDGTNDQLDRSTLGSLLFGTNQANVFMVLKHDSSAARVVPFVWATALDLNQSGLQNYDDSVSYSHGAVGGGGHIAAAQPVGWDDTWHIIEGYRATDGTGLVVMDGTTIVSGTFTDDLDNTGTANLTVGFQSGRVFKGQIAALYLMPTAQSAANRLALKTYLATKYAITVV